MIKIEADHKNRKVVIQIENISKLTHKGIRTAFYNLGKDMKATAKKNILKKPRFGRVYNFRGQKHIASVEGESFANRSGDALVTLGWQTHGSDSMDFGFKANANTLYTKILEEKKNRPTLQIAVESNWKNAQTHFNREIERSLEGKGGS